MSPVDGGDPLGELPYFVITPGEKVNFTVPTLELITEFDEVVSSKTYTLSSLNNVAVHCNIFYGS